MTLQTNLTGSTPQGTPTSPTHSAMHNSIHAIVNTLIVIDGINYQQTRAGIQAAHDDLPSTGGDIIIPPDIEIVWDTTAVEIIKDKIRILSSPSSILKPPASSDNVSLFKVFGTGGAGNTAKSLTANAPEGQSYVVIGSAAVTALQGEGLVVGDFVTLSQDLTDTVNNDVNEGTHGTLIVSIDQPNGALHLSEPVPLDFTTAKNAVIQKSGVIKDVILDGLVFDGNGNTGITHGIETYFTQNLKVRNIIGNLIPRATVYNSFYSYGALFEKLISNRGGNSASGTFNLEFVNAYSATFKDMRVVDSAGWGIEIKGTNYSRGYNLYGSHCQDRNIKFQHVRHAVFSNLEGHGSYTKSGISVGGDIKDLRLQNLITKGNNQEGFLIAQIPSGTNRCKYLTVDGLTALNNNWGTGTYDIFINSEADDNTFIATKYGTLNDLGTRTVIGSRLFFRPQDVSALTGSPVLAPVGSSANSFEKAIGWSFDGSSNEYVQTILEMPADWDWGEVQVKLLWSPSTSGSGDVRWAYEWEPWVIGTTQIDTGLTLVAQNFATPAVADQVTESVFTTKFTPTTRHVKFNILRNAGNAADTYNGLDVWLFGVEIIYGTNR